jgi:thiol-disulfide isomerase/thioredoxin
MLECYLFWIGVLVKRVHFITAIMAFFSVLSYAQVPILTDMEGRKIALEALKGKWVLINYWASWCQPCLDEIRELNQFYEKHQDKVALFAVNYDALPLGDQKRLITQYDLHYPSLSIDPAYKLKLEQPRGVPATFIFNPQGELSKILYGGQTLKSLTKAIAAF